MAIILCKSKLGFTLFEVLEGCTSSKLLCANHFLLVWVEMLLALVKLNQGDSNW
jgi:hypothetical protein